MKAVSPNTEAVLLLAAPLLIGEKAGSIKPLAPKEYGEVAIALMKIDRQPADLLQDSALLDQIAQGEVADRCRQLLNRGLQLSQALDLWGQRGIKVLSRADPEYPRALKKQLRDKAPILLYCCGNLQLFNKRSLAVVGSRKVNNYPELVSYADNVGAACAREQIAVVSGGANGADKVSMLGCLKKGGCSVGILSCSLKQEVLSKDYKPYLRENRLLLCSAVDPSAGWNTGMAMQRNKYIYALAKHAIVVASETKGGTWSGATEQLNKLKFCPIMVNVSVRPSSGNKKLIKMGASPLVLDFSENFSQQLSTAESASASPGQAELFAITSQDETGSTPLSVTPEVTIEMPQEQIEQAVFPILRSLLLKEKTSTELVELTKLKKGQLDDWLRKMCEQGIIRKLNKPVRYLSNGGK
jgi:DNA processing protein